MKRKIRLRVCANISGEYFDRPNIIFSGRLLRDEENTIIKRVLYIRTSFSRFIPEKLMKELMKQ